MKKYLTGLTALALAIAFSAFSVKQPQKAGDTQDRRWAKTNLNGTIPSSPQIYNGSEADARLAFECPTDGENFCAKAVNELNQEIPGVDPLMRD